MTAMRWPLGVSVVKPEVHHIAVGDDIILAFPKCHGPQMRAIQVTATRFRRKVSVSLSRVRASPAGWPALRRAMTAVRWPLGASIIKPKMHHVAVGDDIILAFPKCHGPQMRAIQVTATRFRRKVSVSLSRVRASPAGWPALRRAMTAVRWPLGVSVVKSEVHHIAVGDDIVFAFQPEFARIARARFALAGDIIAIGNGFGADETLLEIGVDHAGGLGRA